MDTRHLRYIVEIASCGSITRAAEKLYISQSGLNQQLQRIERELGATLFERTTHSLEITEAGEVMVQYARDAIAREERVQAMVGDVVDGTIGTLRVNLAMEQGAQLFCAIYPAFYAKYPGISLRLMDHTVAEQYALLARYEMDIGMVMVTRHDQPHLEYVHLANERFLLGVPKNHPLADTAAPEEYPELDLSLCREEKFSLMFSGSTLRQAIDPCFEEAGFSPQIIFESRNNHIAALMAANGICLTILPESQARLYPEICWFRLTTNPTWESCMIYHKENPPRKAGRFFIDLAIQNAGFLETVVPGAPGVIGDGSL